MDEKERDERAQAGMITIASQMFEDPRYGPIMDQFIAEKFPQAQNPRHTARKVVNSELETERAERRKLEERLGRQEASRALEAERRKIQDDPSLRIRPEEIEAVEKLMVDETIGNHVSAAELYRARQHVGSPTITSGAIEIAGMDGVGGDFYKGLFSSDPNDKGDKWARKVAHETIATLRNGGHQADQLIRQWGTA